MTAIPANSDAFRVGDWSVDPLANQMILDGKPVVLRAQVMELLVYLANRAGFVVSLETIHDELWRGKVVSSGTIYNCIAELRQAFSVLHPNGEYVETIPKKGYRLIAPVVFPAAKTVSRETSGNTVVAILPLHNRGEAADEYLCDGIAEEILHSLSKVKALRVVSGLSLKGMDLSNQEVGRRFNADSVLAGSLQRAGLRLRLNFRLEDVVSGQVLWSDHSDQQLSDIFELQDNVARQVVDALSSHLGLTTLRISSPSNSGTQDIRALNEFLLGRYAFSSCVPDDYDVAIAHFERAVQFDPQFARAYYCLYLACYFRTRYRGSGTQFIERARFAAGRARELGYHPAVPWIHIHRRLNKQARIRTVEMGREAIEKFRARDPEWRSFAYEQLAWVLSASGMFRAALEFARHAQDSPSLNFQDSDVDEELFNWEAGVGNYQAAIRKLSSLIQQDPRVSWYRHERCTLYCRIGDFARAEEEITALEELGASTRNSRITYAFWQGDIDTARELLGDLRSLSDSRPMYECINHALVGETKKAVEYFYRATDPSGDFAFVDLGFMRAKARYALPSSLLTELENQPRFKSLLQGEGLDENWRQWLKRELNSIREHTGIEVKYDQEY